jgi:hypothetical protein
VSQLKLPAQNRSVASIVIGALISLALIYVLPYFVPVNDGLSHSYAFGYSNRTAILLLLVSTAVFALWTRGLGLTLPERSIVTTKPFRRTAYVAITTSVLGALLVWLFAIRTVPYAEASYFLDRYEMYHLFGHPYRAFTFIYGPIMFYLPIWLARVLSLSIGNAYYLALVGEWALGTWMLWKVIHSASRGTSHGRAIFVLFWLLFLPALSGSGANYTPLRFVPTLYFALMVENLYFRGAPIITTFGAASMGMVATLFYSPEQGLSFFMGTLFFFLICVRRRRVGTFLGLIFFVGAFGVAALVALKTGLLASVMSIGNGALNFPLAPSFQSLFLLLLLIVAGCVVVASVRNNTLDHPLVYLICLSLFSLPAALSRADPGHIFINTLGALIAVTIVLSQYPAIWQWLRIAFVGLVICSFIGLGSYRNYLRDQILVAAFNPYYRSAVIQRLVVDGLTCMGSRGTRRLHELQAEYSKSVNDDGPSLPAATRVMAPFGYKPRIERSPGDAEVIGGYAVVPFTSVAMVQSKIDELAEYPELPLLIPTPQRVSCEENLDQMRAGLETILGEAFLPRPRRAITSVEPLCDYINSNYRPSEYSSHTRGFYVWLRNGIEFMPPNGHQ